MGNWGAKVLVGIVVVYNNRDLRGIPSLFERAGKEVHLNLRKYRLECVEKFALVTQHSNLKVVDIGQRRDIASYSNASLRLAEARRGGGIDHE